MRGVGPRIACTAEDGSAGLLLQGCWSICLHVDCRHNADPPVVLETVQEPTKIQRYGPVLVKAVEVSAVCVSA